VLSALREDGWGLALAGALCLGLLLAGEWLHRARRWRPEATRKGAHVSLGLVAAAFPALFSGPVPPLLLSAVFVLLMAGTKAAGRLRSVHGVERRSCGAACFPIAVGLVCLLSQGRPDVYVASLLVLTLADTAAAVAGALCGRHRYPAGGAFKSVEGSLAFAVAAFASLLPLLAVGTRRSLTESVAAAGCIALLAAGVEAFSPCGTDNLLVPVSVCVAYRAVDLDPAGAGVTGTLWLAAGLACGFLLGRARRVPSRGNADAALAG
jgi:phytol kinase